MDWNLQETYQVPVVLYFETLLKILSVKEDVFPAFTNVPTANRVCRLPIK